MRKQLSVMAGVAAAAFVATSAQAGALTLVATATTAGDALPGGMQSYVISVSGGVAGNSMLYFGGGPAGAFEATTGDGSGFFNVDSWVFLPGIEFNGQSAFASIDASALGFPQTGYDSGFLEFAGGSGGTGVTPLFTTDVGSFAFGDGTDGTTAGEGIFDADPLTAVDMGSDIAVARITWSATTSATITATVSYSVPLSGEPVSELVTITLPAVPAPGAMALLGLAGICGVSRRRRKA